MSRPRSSRSDLPLRRAGAGVMIMPALGTEELPAMRAEERGGALPAGEIETVCPRCGRSFACCPAGPCWCGKEAFKLPREALEPALGCYCPDCLAVVAAEALGGPAP